MSLFRSFCFSGQILITYAAVSVSTEIRVSAVCPRQLELITGRADESTPKQSPHREMGDC